MAHLCLMKFFLVLMLFISVQVSLAGANIHGTVNDAESKEPLVAATVILEKTSYNAIADSKGNFEIRNLHPGEYFMIIGFHGIKIPVF